MPRPFSRNFQVGLNAYLYRHKKTGRLYRMFAFDAKNEWYQDVQTGAIHKAPLFDNCYINIA